jgi:hypothetical protein
LYPRSPDPPVSVDAFHATFTCPHETALAVTPVGVEGGVASPQLGVVALAAGVTDEKFDALSIAATV